MDIRQNFQMLHFRKRPSESAHKIYQSDINAKFNSTTYLLCNFWFGIEVRITV